MFFAFGRCFHHLLRHLLIDEEAVLAAFGQADKAVGFVIAVAHDQHLAARVVECVFHPGPSDSFSGDEAADRKLLRHQNTFQRSNGVGQDENFVAINKVSGSKSVEAG